MARAYLANGVDIHGGIVIKTRGSAPALLVSAMELEEAAKSGLRVVTYDDLDWDKIYLAAEGDAVKARVNLWGKIFEYFEVQPGKIGLYGTGDIGHWLELTQLLAEAYPNYQLTGEMGKSLFDDAFLTKDADEIRVDLGHVADIGQHQKGRIELRAFDEIQEGAAEQRHGQRAAETEMHQPELGMDLHGIHLPAPDQPGRATTTTASTLTSRTIYATSG